MGSLVMASIQAKAAITALAKPAMIQGLNTRFRKKLTRAGQVAGKFPAFIACHLMSSWPNTVNTMQTSTNPYADILFIFIL